MKIQNIVSFRKSKHARIQHFFQMTKLMTFGRTGLTIGLFDAELSNCEPLWGDGRKEKIEFDLKNAFSTFCHSTILSFAWNFWAFHLFPKIQINNSSKIGFSMTSYPDFVVSQVSTTDS